VTGPPSVSDWPALDFADWADTHDTLHMCLQMVGKVKLALSPFLNQWWEVAFQLTARGLSTGTIPYRNRTFDIEFDFVSAEVVVRVSDGTRRDVALGPRPVAEFYHELMTALTELDIAVTISTAPAEVADGTPFETDTAHTSYDGEAVRRWWHVLLSVEQVINRYRTGFRGKASPVLFYWGGFDLNHTRFNGNRATPPKRGGRLTEFGEDEENFAIGFWPGSAAFPHAVFYAYVTPAPATIEAASISPAAARFEPTMQEFVLLYDDARRHESPAEAITEFFDSAYQVSARLAGWDTASLVAHVPDLAAVDQRGAC
jgi:hypothetical protein